MIKLENKKDCCGCMACVQICPNECIGIKSDEEGFNYPSVNTDACINCGLCNKVCPIINNKKNQHIPLKVYASKNLNEDIRLESSSGGIFTALAEKIIKHDGVVFGVSFDKHWNAVHTYTETIEGISAFRGSKYVQSYIGATYKEVKSYLKKGREVLFSGTPCQIAGLKRYLMKEYPNLITIEILCHGVPSPKVWQKYLNEKKKEFKCNDIVQINFRDKIEGWSKYHFTIKFKNGLKYDTPFYKDIFFKGFLNNLYLRPSCYSCKCKNDYTNSDIIIADYWNINEALPQYNDNKGISLILVNSEKGLSFIHSLSSQIEFIETGYDICIKKNGGFLENILIPEKRTKFFSLLEKNNLLSNNIDNCLRTNLYTKIRNKLNRIFNF